MENKIELTLGAPKVEETIVTNTEETTQVSKTKVEPTNEIENFALDTSRLSADELAAVENFVSQIDINSSDQIMRYGSQAQQKIATFSEEALNNVRTKDLGEVGDMMTSLIGELKGFEDEEEEQGGFFGFFKKQVNKVDALKNKYDKVEVNVDRIVKNLEDHQIVLLKDIAMLDELYEKNNLHFKELTMYILAGQKKLALVKENELKQALLKAEQSGRAEDAQAVNDLQNLITRFDKKLHDLELTRTITLQMAPQIRLVQNNDVLMTEKIQSTLVNTIPLWKSQMIIAMGLAHSEAAMKAERATNDFTNEMLKKNAEKLKMATVETAKEAERGIVDIQTLTETNKLLIDTLDEVARIQAEGQGKRNEARKELERAERELVDKLKEINVK